MSGESNTQHIQERGGSIDTSPGLRPEQVTALTEALTAHPELHAELARVNTLITDYFDREREAKEKNERVVEDAQLAEQQRDAERIRANEELASHIETFLQQFKELEKTILAVENSVQAKKFN